MRALRLLLLGAALAFFFDPDNGPSRRKSMIKRLAKLRQSRTGELSDDLVEQTRAAQE